MNVSAQDPFLAQEAVCKNLALTEVPGTLSILKAPTGEPLLVFGEDAEGNVSVIWPLPALRDHAIAFGRWSRRNAHRWKGKRILLQHPLCERTRRWAQWLGCTLTDTEVTV